MRVSLFRPLLAVATLFSLGSVSPALAQDRDPAPAAYLVPEASTGGAAIAIGPDGAIHMATTSYNDFGNDTVTYAVCRADCMADASWTKVTIPVAGAERAELAVTPAGAPRMLISATSTSLANGTDFIYAECGGTPAKGAAATGTAACLTPGGWTMAKVATNQNDIMSFMDVNLPQRTFALDNRGNPRFVFTDENYSVEPDHYGAFYLSCDSSCTNARNWTETNIAAQINGRTESFNRPVLAMGPNGSAHVLSWIYSLNADGSDGPWDVFYLECLSNCANRASWNRVSVINPGTGSYPSPTWDLTIDAQGRPRGAIFMGAAPELEGLDHSLIYVYCDSGCTTEDGWNGSLIYGDSLGESPAITLDRDGHPRIAFLTPDAEPVLAACDASCESPEGSWNGFIFESDSSMSEDRPTALPFTCDGELWNALSPDLAIAANGQAYVTFDVTVQARCLYQVIGDPQVTYEFHEIWHGARIAEVPAP